MRRGARGEKKILISFPRIPSVPQAPVAQLKRRVPLGEERCVAGSLMAFVLRAVVWFVNVNSKNFSSYLS